MKNYYTLIAAMITINLAACKKSDQTPAQIIHQELNKTLAYNQHFLLDANNDAKNDLYFTSVLITENNQPYLYLLINTNDTGTSKVLVQQGDRLNLGGYWIKPVSQGTKISAETTAGLQWNQQLDKGIVYAHSDNGTQKTYLGPWIATPQAFIGFSFKKDEQTYYGWIRVRVTQGDDSVQVLDYAYNNLAGEPIVAGQQ